LSSSSPRPDRVAVVGAGPIGVAWALTFARGGLLVTLHDADPDAVASSRSRIVDRLDRLHSRGLLDESVAVVADRISPTDDLSVAVDGTAYVQECVAERLDVKQELVRRLHELIAADVVIASSSSAITTSALASGLPGRERCLVAHPANPPYLLPAVEIVPAPFTSASSVLRAQDLLVTAGMHPVVLRREVEGFVMNRLQAAVLREAYCLVRDGVASVDDVDTVVRDGLGRRWAFSGPFETADLNTAGGIRAHADRLGPAYQRLGAERGQHDPWTADLVDDVTAQRRALLPVGQWAARNLWREERLMDLLVLHAGGPTPHRASPGAGAPLDDARV
jgi:L-gulonate 3-dehydrogenase